MSQNAYDNTVLDETELTLIDYQVPGNLYGVPGFESPLGDPEHWQYRKGQETINIVNTLIEAFPEVAFLYGTSSSLAGGQYHHSKDQKEIDQYVPVYEYIEDADGDRARIKTDKTRLGIRHHLNELFGLLRD